MEVNDKLKEQFGEKWIRHWEPFINTPAFDAIFSELKSRKGKKIVTLPGSADVFNVFAKTDPDNLKVVIVGLCPYHTVTKDGTVIADGLAMSCSRTKQLQPTLSQVYQDMENTYSDTLDMDMIQNPDLTFLAQQGVMLYNIALTTQEQKAGSDVNLWSKFNQEFFKIMNEKFRGLVFVFLGTEAARSEKLLQPMLHYSYVLPHPASASYSNTQWDSDKVWKKINEIIKSNYGTAIRWYERKGDEVPW